MALLAVAVAVSPGSARPAVADEYDGYGPFQRYSLRWYGQNYYDHQHSGIGSPRFFRRQYHSGIYGPAMLYGRQYSDQYGFTRERPFYQKQGPSPVEAQMPPGYNGYGPFNSYDGLPGR